MPSLGLLDSRDHRCGYWRIAGVDYAVSAIPGAAAGRSDIDGTLVCEDGRGSVLVLVDEVVLPIVRYDAASVLASRRILRVEVRGDDGSD